MAAHRRIRTAVLATTATAGLAGLAGCSASQDNPDVIAGKKLFVQKCGSCHTLARAGTKGTTGPNLDQAFVQDKVDNFGTSAIRGMVKKQIEYPRRGGVMPAKLVTGNQADDIAAYVAQVAAAPGKDQGLLASAVQAPGAGKPAVETNGTLSIAADPNGQLAYVAKTATAKAGAVTIEMPNQSGVPHNLDIQGVGKTAVIPKGVAKFSATLKPGKYTYFCDVPGHKQAGMQGTLTVQ